MQPGVPAGSPPRRKKYLFIRLLEACDAGCFMCGYANSNDRYRFSLEEFESLLPHARDFGVRFVRFTGGEPLLHKDAVGMVRAGTGAGMQMSLITNGSLLARKIEPLARAGLAQVIVSLDGATADAHDGFRNTPGLFEKGLAGLRLSRALGVRTRVNTVVGPHNYAEMPRLQRVLAELEIAQWELSALKLERRIVYRDPSHVREVCEPLYAAGRLKPMGKRFYGDTAEEQALFFDRGITPRADGPRCNTIGDVVYLDAKSGRAYGCSLLPHRSGRESGGGVALRTGNWSFDSRAFAEHVRYFRDAGPKVCTGCSTSAAGYSASAGTAHAMDDWSY